MAPCNALSEGENVCYAQNISTDIVLPMSMYVVCMYIYVCAISHTNTHTQTHTRLLLAVHVYVSTYCDCTYVNLTICLASTQWSAVQQDSEVKEVSVSGRLSCP